jgi:hypothetical protein
MIRIITLISGLFFLIGCTKPLIDYRSKYVGTYDVVSYNSSWIMGQVQQSDTTFFTITVKRADERYYVDFINANVETSYLIETDGELHYESQDYHYQVSGRFTDKNHFELSGGYHGLGGGNSFKAFGTKQK